MNGFSIFFDNTNKIMKDLSASIDYSIDLRKERYYSLNSILSNLSNTIDQTENQKIYPEMTVLSMAPLLAGLIHAVEENSSLSEVLAHAFDD